jgi:hypothetical protein
MPMAGGLWLVLLLAAGAPEPAPVPPAGAAALLVRPDDGIAPAGFSLVLSPAGDPDGEKQYPAGEWLVPPAGEYWAFLEGPQAIGWSATRLELAPRRGEGQGVELVLPVRDDFLLMLERRPPARQAADQEVSLKLNFPGGERRPDLVVPTANRVYALWYGLPPGAHRLLASSSSHFLGDRVIELRSGKVGHLSLPLDRRPNVRVKLELPESLRRAGPLTLEMRSMRPQVWLDPWKVKANAEEMLLEKVPPGDSEIALRSPPWVFRSRLDLRGGEDRELVIAPYEIEVDGNLTLGGEGTTGKIPFNLPDQEKVEAETDAEGRYQISLWRHGLYEVTAEVPGRLPYRQLVEIQEAPKKALDIEVPATSYAVRAIDKTTRRPLAIKTARISSAAAKTDRWKASSRSPAARRFCHRSAKAGSTCG